ncbi:chromosome segregation protein SMC [Temperatibacter marinus]|uniref:Chromosome partition protein Smc n=1 Tax=Temperatibacter marinus TaxID=1456591 RepID=A0AA52H8M2_9PROT|nr:chromosome segregation protein SMC [Temperatibacter marinus]WND01989.1 chromosome segregation protein SMC [Temperatibacter marinus]
MDFSRLRLSGFKSFVEPTELHIEPGLTGVVGPNGCGKSNLLEAIRWVMGENRAKSLRGSGMDDVIFAGTGKRPARNLAEVTLVLDNFERDAPAGYNDHDTIEVTRRIERESGSSYRINGKDVRQKDVQLLFADAATGAHSPSLVSQGRIGALINAKPQERRLVLEEAAGISGLHQRRKEAESRLRGAEGNLTRLQDVVGQMEVQISSLKRQARQAARYKAIAGEIRQVEASLLYLRWQEASEQVIASESKMRQAGSIVAEIVKKVAILSKEQAHAASLLPNLREADASAAAALQRLGHEKESLENEVKRREETHKSLLARREQLHEDKGREDEIAKDAQSALDRLSKEKSSLEKDKEREKDKESEARDHLESAQSAAGEAEREFDTLSEVAAQARARKSSLESDLLAINRRLERLNFDGERLKKELKDLENDESGKTVKSAEENVESSKKEREKISNAVEAIEIKLNEARLNLSQAQTRTAEFESAYKATLSEVKALEDLIASASQKGASPLSEDITATAGYETAVGSVFGEDIDASKDAEETRYWQMLKLYNTAPEWPLGVKPLSEIAKVPEILSRRMLMTGVLMDEDADGSSLAEMLKPGQRIVSKDGRMWRWDGFVKKAGAPSRAALRLTQQNRLTDLNSKAIDQEKAFSKSTNAVQKAEAIYKDLQEEDSQARASRGDAERALQASRRALLVAEQEESKKATRLNAIQEQQGRLKSEREDQKARHKEISDKVKDLPEIETLENDLKEKRAVVEKLRAELSAARTKYDGLHRESTARLDRLKSITSEMQAWQVRKSSAQKHLDDLFSRADDLEQQLEALAKGPENMEQRQQLLLSALAKAEESRTITSDKLVSAEATLSEVDERLKKATLEQNEAREIQIRLEAAVENAADRRRSIAAQVGERFECAPTEVLEKVGVEDIESLPAMNNLEENLERMRRERDRIGAVNLRADEELKEIEDSMGGMLDERRDLEEAIARLRHAIADLNKEGRERLLLAFEEVNSHFEDLFQTLFGGGQAHLALTESDDPLNAGLEIFASPPGKRLQALSLLSGGEQALTALSLIFAVFITNPSPICVLDEVDAPLDDANVDRFCNLLEDMIDRTKTRFMIVTHNAVSMSRVNRLFGVTMAERGVSTLVSVDLEKAEALLEG